MKIVFIGCVRFSKDSLLKLIHMNAEIIGVITKENSNFNADFYDLSTIARDYKIPYKHVKDINHINNTSWIQALSPDIIFCFGWSSLLKNEILQMTPMGVVGYHPADLPNNRGRHPLIWAKVLGLEESASTFFFMNHLADCGDILSQKRFPIVFEESAVDLYKKMTDTAIEQLEEFVPQLESGSYQRLRQDESVGNVWRKRGKQDGYIDFRMTTRDICNLVRALSYPYIGAHCLVDGIEKKIWRVDTGNFQGKNIEPGKVLNVQGNTIEVKTADSSILIIEHDIVDLPALNSYLI
jgi:methionyl-tRNA formyltransferase